MDTPPIRHPTFLKAHKAFPRRPVQINNPPLGSASQSLLWQHESQHEALPKSAQIESWIPEPDIVHLTLDHSLPLTPPSNSPEEEGTSWIEGSLPDDNKVTTRSVSSGITTPVIQRSPPTPETTPPRASHLQHSPSSVQDPPNQSTGTRTDSFKTAREHMSSDDESSHPQSPSMQPSRQKWLKQTAHARLREIGLGLGLESESDETSPREVTPKVSLRKQEFVTFDGSWGASHHEAAAAGDDAGVKNIISKRFLGHTTEIAQSPEKNFSVVQAPMSKSLSWRQGLDKDRKSQASSSTEKLVEGVNRPLLDSEQLDLAAKVREVDERRISQMSTASTIEAIVIDSPSPKRRQTLRHTGKFSKFDPAGTNSNRSSMLSNQGSHQPRKLRHTGSPDQIKRGSVTSDTVLGATSSQSRKRRDSIPVIVVPERRSSLRDPVSSGRRLSRKTSLTSGQQAKRPTTAPQGATGYFDGLGQDRRTVSAQIPSPTSVNLQEKPARETIAKPLLVTPVGSANASRKVSRATSATSGSGIIFNGLQEHPTPSQPPVQSDEAHDSQIQNLQGVSFDWSAIRPRSTQVTPFSLRSAHSSTPGTLEVNEATAVSIYPHTNKSILVVQQLPSRDSESVEHSAVVASNASFAIPGPHAPAVLHHTRARNLLESPLKNPREPPQPPAFKVIPAAPTPNLSSTNSLDRKAALVDSSHTRISRFSRPITTIKRALSARRYSEAIISPLTRGLHRRSSTTTRKRASYSSDRDTRLHPFWRPRGFWDDFTDSDSDSEFGNDGPLVGNSLGMPAAHTVTKISAQQKPRRSQSLTQRVSRSLRFSSSPGRGTNSVRRRNTITADGSGASGLSTPRFYRRNMYEQDPDANRSYEFIQPEHASALVRQGGGMPRLGYQVQFVGLKGLAEKMEKRKERRQEGKRERLREKLRGSIGPVVPVQGSAPQGWGGVGYLRGV